MRDRGRPNDPARSCTLTREPTEGPYYFDVDAIRSDIREDRQGTTLRLGILVQDSDSCEPIPDAVVDVWHCDAEGIYSGFESASQDSDDGRDIDNASDSIFEDSLVLTVRPAGDGYLALITFGVDPA